MRQLQAHEHGEPLAVMKVVDVDEHRPGHDEVRIASYAVGLNFLDVSRCRGTYPAPSEMPMKFGVEVAGRLVETGAAVPHLLGRDALACPTLPRGALGERVVVDARFVVERPVITACTLRCVELAIPARNLS